MFWKRKAAAPPKAAPGDRELEAAQAGVAARQEHVAQLELDLFNSHAELAAFNAEIEQRVAPLQRKLEALEAELTEARRQSSRRAIWGARASSPEIPEDAVAQYSRIWGWGSRPAEVTSPPPPSPAPSGENELKSLYRSLAKRYHPDLAQDPADKPGRERMMTRVNDAYAARDLAALRKLAAEGEPAPAAATAPTPKTRDQVLDELRVEIDRLDELAVNLEAQLDALAKSPAVQLKLDALWARRAGGDLLGDMARQLQADIRRAENELAKLR